MGAHTWQKKGAGGCFLAGTRFLAYGGGPEICFVGTPNLTGQVSLELNLKLAPERIAL